MEKTEFDELGLTITQAAHWLDVEPSYLARALEDEEYPQWVFYSLEGMKNEYQKDAEPFQDWIQDYILGWQLEGSKWMQITARAAIPVLIEQAQKRELISYGDLVAELRKRDPSRQNAGVLSKYAFPLGIIGEVIDEIRYEAADESSFVNKINALMPPLEALVVRKKDRLPGVGVDAFLVSYLRLMGKISPEVLIAQDRKKAVESIHAEIFDWADWSVLDGLVKNPSNRIA